jgi:hypothetical protein
VAGPVELVPLQCLRCSAPIPAETNEVAWVCAQCGQASLLDDLQGLVPLEVLYSTALPAQGRGKPYWAARGRVRLERNTYKGNQRGESESFWAQPRLFCIPAYDCSLDVLLAEGKKMLMLPAALQTGKAAPFEPVVLPIADVRASAEFLVTAIEAERKDMLRRLQFDLELETPVLWILP